jgi:hypothetical protein
MFGRRSGSSPMDGDERPLSPEEIRAQIAEAARRKSEAHYAPRTTKQRRAGELKQRKTRVNGSLLRGAGAGRDETWTIRARAEQIRSIKELAEELSEPRAKVSVAALMEEAMELVIAKYREGRSDA